MLAMVLLIAGLFLPLRWLLRVWLDDRLVSGPLAVGAMAAHVGIFIATIYFLPIVTIAYSLLILLLIGISPRLMGRLHLQADQRMAEEDISKYQRLIERDPNHAAAHAALADALMVFLRYDEAIAEYERAIELAPQYSDGEILKLRRARLMKEASEKSGKCTP
jgi:tetratricopeptide (TPR) repeat protein